MPNPNLYLIFNPFGSLWLNLPFIFYQNRAKLAKYGIIYQYTPNTALDVWQRYGVEDLPRSLSLLGKAYSQAKEYLQSSLDKIHSQLSPENKDLNLLWDLQPISPQDVEELKKWCSYSPVFSNYNIKPIVVIMRHDFVFRQWIMSGWQNGTYNDIIKAIFNFPHFLQYAPTYKELARLFGPDCTFIEVGFQDAKTQLLSDTVKKAAKTLCLPNDIFAGNLPVFLPESFAGLNLHAATRDFCFTRGGRLIHDRHAFWAMLRHVENEEGFAKFTGVLPEEIAQAFIADAQADNAQLEELLGYPVFTDYPAWNEAELYSAPFPTITDSQARPFVAAMPENLRFDLLRYFRDFPGELSTEQAVLAKTLEDFRAQNNWIPNFQIPRPEPVLSVLTMTRNHKDYIADCMESVIAQKTDFPIEHIIIDDASDDGTQDIIDNYAVKHPHIRPIYMPGQGASRNVSMLFSACKSEYAALCDGDDYFTDPNKLQMQVDFLRENKDCSVCFHPVHVKFENGQRNDFIFPMLEQLPRKSKQRFYLADLVQGNFIQTNSVVYRWRFRDGLPELFNPYLCPGDWYWHLLHAETGKIGFIPRVMSVYRRHSSALYSSAFIDRDKHFAEHGMHEVETINILNQHFKGRYFRHLANLADSFFTSFYKRQIEDPECHALDEACEKYPEFGLHFLKTLRSVQKEHPAR